MGLSVVEQHFKDEADRNREDCREAHRKIGWLRSKSEHATKESAYFKTQYNSSFRALQDARNEITSLATEIADSLGSDSEESERIDGICDTIENKIDEILSHTFSPFD